LPRDNSLAGTPEPHKEDLPAFLTTIRIGGRRAQVWGVGVICLSINDGWERFESVDEAEHYVESMED
jgi:hypothetical protein